MKKNVQLLRKIQKRLMREPRQFQMDTFYDENPGWDVPDSKPGCGTAACIAGHACSITRRISCKAAGLMESDTESEERFSPWAEARDKLGLTEKQAQILFYAEEWPEPYCAAYACNLDSGDVEAAAKVAIRRIEHFILTGK